MALADARLLDQKAGPHELLAELGGQCALVSLEPAGEMVDRRVVAAPFALAVEPLKDAACRAAADPSRRGRG